MVAFGGAAFGLVLAANGQVAMGAMFYIGSLVGLAVAISRGWKRRTVLPFSFSSHFLVMTVAVVVAVVIRNRFPAAAVGCFAFFTYYYSCVSLAERKARYIPWGAGFAWRTVTAAERPTIYWVCVGVCLGMAAVLLGLVFAASAGLVPAVFSRVLPMSLD